MHVKILTQFEFSRAIPPHLEIQIEAKSIAYFQIPPLNTKTKHN